MTRWLLIALAATACAKGKDSAPAPSNATADTSAQSSPVAPQPPPADSDPQAARQQALDQARNQASLGVSAKTDSFDPIGEGGAKGDSKPKRSDTQTGRPGDGGSTDVKVGSRGDNTRGNDAKVTYRALIVAVKLDGKPAPAALVKALKAHATKVQACYDETLASSPTLVGQLAVTFTVLPTGALTAGAVGTTTVKQSALESCVITALQATKLAAPLGKTDTKAEVTIMFKAK